MAKYKKQKEIMIINLPKGLFTVRKVKHLNHRFNKRKANKKRGIEKSPREIEKNE